VDAREFDDAIAESDLALALDPVNAEALELKSTATAAIRRVVTLPEPPHPDRPVTLKPAPPPPGPSPAVSQRPGETVDDWYARGRRLQDQYDRAKAALSSGSFQTAINGLTALLRDEPSFRDAPSLLAQARNGLREAVQSVIDAAAKLESGGDLRGALLQYQRAQQMGASDTADQDRVLARMKVEGTRAFNEAGTYFALSRFKDAIARYERAVDYLADDDPNRKIAKERLDGLRGRQ
jgi:tetratricopeptide (TPR) repeat protein